MTPWWEVVIIAAVVLGSGLIGAAIAVRVTGRNADDMPDPPPPSSYLERRAAVYLEVSAGWHAYLESVRTLAFPAEGLSTDRPRDLAAVLRSRAQLEQFGSLPTQRLHDEALEAAVAVINVLRGLPIATTSGNPDLSAGRKTVRPPLRDLAMKVDLLERQMIDELRPAPPPLDPHVEIFGRASAPQRPISGQTQGVTQPRR